MPRRRRVDLSTVIGLCGVLCLALPQGQDPSPPKLGTGFRPSEAVLVSGVVAKAGLRLGGIGLGTGGVRQGAPASPENRTGEFLSPGGVRIRAQREGVKFDFVGGAEVLLSPDGRLHLRDGSKTLPFLRGLRLVLADGTQVSVTRGGSRQPIRSVDIWCQGRNTRIYSMARRVRNASHTGPFSGSTLLCMGDGRSLYEADATGPLLALRRVLCPEDRKRRMPARRLVVLGDVLAASMRLLPKNAPRKSVQFPQVAEAAQRFAALSGRVFQGVQPRPSGAVGELWFRMPEGYRLKVETSATGRMLVGLYGAQGTVPGVEWIVGPRFTVHFVRPDGGLRGGPRYFMKGIDLRKMVDGVYGFEPGRDDRMAVARMVRRMGGQSHQGIKLRSR